MPKYLILKHYRGAPATVNDVPMDQWTPEEVDAHMKFMDDFGKRLEENGEYVDAPGPLARGRLGAVRRRAAPAGHRRPVRRDQGPHRRVVRLDVDGWDRAVELAGELSLAPGKDGKPIHEWLEVRPFYGAPSATAAEPVTRRRARRPAAFDGAFDGALLRPLVPASSASSSAAEPTSRRPRTPCRRRSSRRGARSGPASEPPRDLKGWLVTVAWRRFLDVVRSETARQRREVALDLEPEPGPAETADDTLPVFFLCAHPALTPTSAVALTLRAVAGLTTRQVAEAYLVPEATMAQRISRAKRTVSGESFDRPGDLATVRRVLYLVFNEGYSGDVDLAAEAIRLTRQLAALADPTTTRRPTAARADAAPPRATPGAPARRRDARPPRRPGPLAVGHRADRGGGHRPAGCARSPATRRVPAPGGHRRAARRRSQRRGDRLGAGRAVVRRAAGAHRQPGRAAQPRRGRGRGRRRPRRPRGAGRGRPRRCPATAPRRRTSTRRTATSSRRRGSTPRPPSSRPTSPSGPT